LKTVECDACGTSKAKRQNRREPREFIEEPGAQLAIDLHDHKEDGIGLGDYKCLLLITDRWSGMMWDYYLTDHKSASILTALKDLFSILKRQYNLKPRIIECDNEIYLKQKSIHI